MIFGSHTEISQDFIRAGHYLPVSYGKYANQPALSLLIQDNPGHEKPSRGKAEQRLCLATQGTAWRSTAKAWQLLDGLSVPGVLSFSIKNICDAEQVPGRPKMNINLFCCSCVGMSEAGGNKLDWNAFFIQGRSEIMPKRMRSKPRYPGVPGEFFA